MLEFWRRYKARTKLSRRRLRLWFFLFGGKLIGYHSFKTLNKICVDLARREKHFKFVRIVRFYDSRLLISERADSVRSGGAALGSLNVFRVFSGEYSAFEKIYRKDAVEWLRCRFFYENVLPQLEGSPLKIPRLLKAVEGDRLLLAHFELVLINTLTRHEYLSLAYKVICSLRLQALSVRSEDRWLCDWQGTTFFADRASKSRKFLVLEGLSIEPFERLMNFAEKLPRFVSHGDLNRSNVAGANLVYDWDCFGYFPPGFDVALVVALCLDEDRVITEEVEAFVSMTHAGLEAILSFADYRYHVLFLALLMTSRKSAKLALYHQIFA